MAFRVFECYVHVTLLCLVFYKGKPLALHEVVSSPPHGRMDYLWLFDIHGHVKSCQAIPKSSGNMSTNTQKEIGAILNQAERIKHQVSPPARTIVFGMAERRDHVRIALLVYPH